MRTTDVTVQISTMKKNILTLLLSAVSIIVSAQIPAIQPTETKYDLTYIYGGVSIGYDREQSVYELVVSSDNQFEDKMAIISLGKSSDEAMNSLVNLRNTTSSVNMEFEVEGYAFYVPKDGKLVIKNIGKLNYTAGTYEITNFIIETMMKHLIAYEGASVGENFTTTVNFVGKFSAMIDVVLPLYGNQKLTADMILNNLNNKFSSVLKAKGGYVLTKNDIVTIAQNIENGKIRNDRESLFFLKIAETIGY